MHNSFQREQVYQRAGVKPIQDDLKKVMFDVSGAHTTDSPAKVESRHPKPERSSSEP